MQNALFLVMPAKAGIYEHSPNFSLLGGCSWAPAFAGVTGV
jgi:hypothetical protein